MSKKESALAKRHAEQANTTVNEPSNENDSTVAATNEAHVETKEAKSEETNEKPKPDMKALVDRWAVKRAKVEQLKRELKSAQDDLSTSVMQLDSGGLTKFRYKGEQHIIMHRGDSWFTKGESKTEVVDFD